MSAALRSVTLLTLPTGSTHFLHHAVPFACNLLFRIAAGRTQRCPSVILMAKDQLRQPNLAEMSAASAQDSHGPPGQSTHVQKHALTRPSPAAVESSTTPKEPPNPQLTSQHSRNPTDGGQSTVRSTDTSPAGQSDLSERNLAQEKALRRLNGLDSRSKRARKAPDAASTASTQPVLVREYSQSCPRNSGTKPARMKQKRNSGSSRHSSEMPPLESFSFQDILASVDPEIRGSIDKIAEICGRSRMSLADEYSSHLPPHGDFSMPSLQDHGDQAGVSRLEPVEEVASAHEEDAPDPRSTRARAARLSLVRDSNGVHKDLSSAPVTATSAVASHTQSVPLRQDTRPSEVEASFLPQLLAWLTSSHKDSPRSSRVSRRDSEAANALQRILSSSAESTIN